MRERARNLIKGHAHTQSESDFVIVDEMLNLAKQHGEVYPIMMETLKRYVLLLDKEMNTWVLCRMSTYNYLLTVPQANKSGLVHCARYVC
jgi:hypothetical protein